MLDQQFVECQIKKKIKYCNEKFNTKTKRGGTRAKAKEIVIIL